MKEMVLTEGRCQWTEKNNENISQDSQSHNQHSNLASSRYRSTVLSLIDSFP